MYGIAAEKSGVSKNATTSNNFGTIQAANNTAALQTALNSGGLVTLTQPGTYNFTDTFILPANARLLVGPGVTVQTAAGGSITTLASIIMSVSGGVTLVGTPAASNLSYWTSVNTQALLSGTGIVTMNGVSAPTVTATTGTGTVALNTAPTFAGNATFNTLSFGAPVTNTGAAYTVAASDTFLIANAAAIQTLTLPTAGAPNIGRTIRVKTIAAFTVVSATTNVVPLAGGAAAAAILAATAGKWADLTADGTNWVIMAGN